MFTRQTFAGLLGLLILVGAVAAADKEVKAKVVSVNAKKMTLTVMTDDGKKIDYDINDETKFVGPRGGVSDKGIKDDRLMKGAEVTLVVAGNNRTLREIRLPERK